MEKYYVYTVGNQIFNVDVINIPDDIKDSDISERIMNFDPYIIQKNGLDELFTIKSVKFTSDNKKSWIEPDIIIDWTNDDNINNDLIIVTTALEESEKYNLSSEVVYHALKHMKENSNLTIAQAIKLGFNEWIK